MGVEGWGEIYIIKIKLSIDSFFLMEESLFSL